MAALQNIPRKIISCNLIGNIYIFSDFIVQSKTMSPYFQASVHTNMFSRRWNMCQRVQVYWIRRLYRDWLRFCTSVLFTLSPRILGLRLRAMIRSKAYASKWAFLRRKKVTRTHIFTSNYPLTFKNQSFMLITRFLFIEEFNRLVVIFAK